MAEAPVDRTRSYVRPYSVPSVSQVTVRFGQTESTGLVALYSCRTDEYSLGLSKGRAKQRATAEGCVITLGNSGSLLPGSSENVIYVCTT